MYGIDGGSDSADLWTIDLATGTATFVGNTGIQAGSLEFGEFGTLFAGGTGDNAGDLFEVDPGSGDTVLIGNTGFSITGLTLGPAVVPVPPAVFFLAIAIACLGRIRLRN